MFDEQMTLLSDSFRNLPTLKTIYCKTQTPPRTLSPFDEQQYPFAGTTPKDATVYVPTGCADIYRNTEGWNYFTNFVETEEFPVLSADMVIGGDTGSVAKAIKEGIRRGTIPTRPSTGSAASAERSYPPDGSTGAKAEISDAEQASISSGSARRRIK